MVQRMKFITEGLKEVGQYQMSGKGSRGVGKMLNPRLACLGPRTLNPKPQTRALSRRTLQGTLKGPPKGTPKRIP